MGSCSLRLLVGILLLLEAACSGRFCGFQVIAFVFLYGDHTLTTTVLTTYCNTVLL